MWNMGRFTNLPVETNYRQENCLSHLSDVSVSVFITFRHCNLRLPPGRQRNEKQNKTKQSNYLRNGIYLLLKITLISSSVKALCLLIAAQNVFQEIVYLLSPTTFLFLYVILCVCVCVSPK